MSAVAPAAAGEAEAAAAPGGLIRRDGLWALAESGISEIRLYMIRAEIVRNQSRDRMQSEPRSYVIRAEIVLTLGTRRVRNLRACGARELRRGRQRDRVGHDDTGSAGWHVA